MSIEVTLVKTSDHPDIKGGRGLPVEAVVGISLPGQRTIEEHSYAYTGQETEEGVSVSREMSERMADFYQQTYALPHDRRPNVNCHAFVAYCLRMIDRPRYTDIKFDHHDSPAVEANNLAPATPYVTVRPDGSYNHSLIGIDRPKYSLSLLGTNNPLTISANGLIKYWYGAKHFAQISNNQN